MHKELGKEPTPHDIEMIKMAIKMVKEKEKNKS
jgi:hypothetical protein